MEPEPRAQSVPPGPSSTLRLDPTAPLWSALLGAFSGVLAYAQGWVDDAPRDPAKAVHEYRKSIRRARALVRLARPLMKDRRYRELDGALKQAVDATSFVRDAEVLRETVGELPASDELQRAAARLREVIDAQQAETCAPARVVELLREAAAPLPPLTLRLAKALPDGLEGEHVERALRLSFKRTRACLAAALVERTDEAIHDWRKRVKELRYQLELVERAPAHGPSREETLGGLAKELGRITDLLVLRASVRAHEAALGPEHAGALVRVLDALIPPRFAAVAEAARPFFDVRAGAFARVVLGRARPEDLAAPAAAAAAAAAAAPVAFAPTASDARPAAAPADAASADALVRNVDVAAIGPTVDAAVGDAPPA